MKVLLRQHGLNLSGVKSDLYTIIGMMSFIPFSLLVDFIGRLGQQTF